MTLVDLSPVCARPGVGRVGRSVGGGGGGGTTGRRIKHMVKSVTVSKCLLFSCEGIVVVNIFGRGLLYGLPCFFLAWRDSAGTLDRPSSSPSTPTLRGKLFWNYSRVTFAVVLLRGFPGEKRSRRRCWRFGVGAVNGYSCSFHTRTYLFVYFVSCQIPFRLTSTYE